MLLPPEDILAVAKGSGLLPASPMMHALRKDRDKTIPEVQAIWRAGGRHLELGCGAGGGLLSLLVVYPRLSGVGVEIDAGAVEEARRRAGELAVADRVELRQTDAPRS